MGGLSSHSGSLLRGARHSTVCGGGLGEQGGGTRLGKGAESVRQGEALRQASRRELAMYVIEGGRRFVIPRTEPTYPGHSMKLHENAADPVKSPVDLVMMDFEDACPYQFKGPKSRETVAQALGTLDFGQKVITVRPNNIRSEFFLGDMEAIMLEAANRFHGIILPKVHDAEDIRFVSRILANLERQGKWKHRVQIEALIETPHALVKAYEIA